MTAVSPQVQPIALTGATGFLGAAIMRRLSDDGYRVRALARPRKGRTPQPVKGVEWLGGDLGDTDTCARLVDGCPGIIHCAGLTRALTRRDFFRGNAEATARLAAAAKAAGVSRFVHISSLAAGRPELSHYAASKQAAEAVLAPFAAAFSLVMVRPPAIYGPGDREMLRLFQGVNAGLVPLPGRADSRLALIFVEDLADIIARLATEATARRLTGCWEVDDGEQAGYRLDTIARTIAEQRDRRPLMPVIPGPLVRLIGLAGGSWARLRGRPVFFTGAKAREALHPDWTCHGNRLNDAGDTGLNWQPQTGIAAGMAQTDAWYQRMGFY